MMISYVEWVDKGQITTARRLQELGFKCEPFGISFAECFIL